MRHPAVSLPALSLLAPALLALALAACGPQVDGPAIAVRDGRLAAPAGVADMSFYADIRNRGSEEDTLVSLTVAGARSAEMHGTHGSASGHTMHETDPVPLPPGRRLILASGGIHGMVGWDTPPPHGDTVEVTLHFARTEPITLRVPVVDGR